MTALNSMRARAETEEIQDRLEAGEPTSKVAKDYPVGESRVSQLKKKPRKSKPYKTIKQKTLSQMPRSLIRRWIEQRFNANNPLVDGDDIDFDAYLDVEDFEFYHDLVDEFKRVYPEYEWYYPRERAMFDPYARTLRIAMINRNTKRARSNFVSYLYF